MVDRELIALLDERVEAIRASADELALMAANVRMASADERYVVRDNLRRMPDVIARAHLRLGRLNAAVEHADEFVSHV